MSFVKLKEKGQVTIPASVREELSAHTGDIFEVAVSDGNIVLTPKVVVARKSKLALAKKKGVDISTWIGSGKGLFKSPEEADAYMKKERAAWD